MDAIKPAQIIVKRQFFDAFADGSKRIEYRRYGGRFTERNFWPGRLVTIRAGYTSVIALLLLIRRHLMGSSGAFQSDVSASSPTVA